MFFAGKKPILTYSWSIASVTMDETQSHDVTVLGMVGCTAYRRRFKMLLSRQIYGDLQIIVHCIKLTVMEIQLKKMQLLSRKDVTEL